MNEKDRLKNILTLLELYDKEKILINAENSWLFLNYLKVNKCKLENYEQILELNQDVAGSLSLLIKDNKQFLLSTKVKYRDLNESELNGAYGYLRREGMYVPKTIEADKHFLEKNVSHIKSINGCYSYPKIQYGSSDYDVVVSKGISKEDEFNSVLESSMDIYLGDILDTSDPHYNLRRYQLLQKLYAIKENTIGFQLNIDSSSKEAKEFILMSRRK